MLSSWNIPFDSINVEESPSAAAELLRRGLRLVPVLTDGERIFHGWDPARLAAFVGVEKNDEAALEPAELLRRLDRILLSAERTIRAAPPQALDTQVPRRERTLRDLVFHLFRLSLACRDALSSGTFPESWLLETPPPGMRDAASLARYGASVRAQLSEWFSRANAVAGQVDTYYGTQTAVQLLERTVWHAAQHLRQLYALLEETGVTPEDKLTPADFEGLPLPESLW